MYLDALITTVAHEVRFFSLIRKNRVRNYTSLQNIFSLSRFKFPIYFDNDEFRNAEIFYISRSFFFNESMKIQKYRMEYQSESYVFAYKRLKMSFSCTLLICYGCHRYYKVINLYNVFFLSLSSFQKFFFCARLSVSVGHFVKGSASRPFSSIKFHPAFFFIYLFFCGMQFKCLKKLNKEQQIGNTLYNFSEIKLFVILQFSTEYTL